MKKVLLLLAAVVAAAPACAEWKLVAKNEKHAWYIDNTTLRARDNNRRIWTMESFPNAAETSSFGSYRSTKSLEEFDCYEDKKRVLQFTAYSGSEGSGSVIYSSDTPWEWKYLIPETYAASVSKAVCALPTNGR